MHVSDVKGNRWQRSMRFLRTLGEVAALGERSHRAGAVRAHGDAADSPDADPNTYFFFLDHLEDRSPFRLEDDAHVGHEHRARHLLGHAADGERRRAAAHQRAGAESRHHQQREVVRAGLRRAGVERRGGQVAGAGAGARHPAERGRCRHHRGRAHSRSEATTEPAAAALDPESRRIDRASPRPAAGGTSSSTARPIARSPTRSSIRRAAARARSASRKARRSCTGISCWPPRCSSASACCSCAIASRSRCSSPPPPLCLPSSPLSFNRR